MRIRALLLGVLVLAGFTFLFGQVHQSTGIHKPAVDDNSKFTNIGNIAITVTNFGVIGHGFRLWPYQPCMEYPRGSKIEHLWAGGLWVGAVSPTGIKVTTGAVDVSALRIGAIKGFEFTAPLEGRVRERSSIADHIAYQLDAVSHQDFIADFADTNTFMPTTGEPLEGHTPLNIAVHQETYAWNFAFADNFVIFNFWIKNLNNYNLDSVYVALYADLVVRNTQITPPTVGSPFFNQGGVGFVDTSNLAYSYDYGGDQGLADSYGAIKFLGSTPYQNKSTYQSWRYRDAADPLYFSPVDDQAKYDKMAFGLTPAQIAGIPEPSNHMSMLIAGPFSTFKAKDSINIVFALLAAKKKSSTPTQDDSPSQKIYLMQAAGWAQRAYNGEDRNGNGVQDTNEIWTNNGQPKRYFLPAPPNPPHVKVIPKQSSVEIYWDNYSEASVDPITSKKDFEGYRIYGTNTGVDLNTSQSMLSNLIVLGEFDRSDDKIGYNTGFNAVKLTPPVQFAQDTTTYYYRFEVPNVLNGWQYAYSVTAFDSGDASIGLESLESSKLYTMRRVIPGTLPNTKFANGNVSVFPNPYYAKAFWDGRGERERKLYFINLPARSEIRIYSLAGDVIDTFDHDAATYSGMDMRWFQNFADGTQQFSGGMHAWDLISQHDQAIATGLYLYTVKDKDSGEIKHGKFLVVK